MTREARDARFEKLRSKLQFHKPSARVEAVIESLYHDVFLPHWKYTCRGKQCTERPNPRGYIYLSRADLLHSLVGRVFDIKDRWETMSWEFDNALWHMEHAGLLKTRTFEHHDSFYMQTIECTKYAPGHEALEDLGLPWEEPS